MVVVVGVVDTVPETVVAPEWERNEGKREERKETILITMETIRERKDAIRGERPAMVAKKAAMVERKAARNTVVS